jgi:hypothetical protein
MTYTKCGVQGIYQDAQWKRRKEEKLVTIGTKTIFKISEHLVTMAF